MRAILVVVFLVLYYVDANTNVNFNFADLLNGANSGSDTESLLRDVGVQLIGTINNWNKRRELYASSGELTSNGESFPWSALNSDELNILVVTFSATDSNIATNDDTGVVLLKGFYSRNAIPSQTISATLVSRFKLDGNGKINYLDVWSVVDLETYLEWVCVDTGLLCPETK
eukprot:TRINITY_DN6291_c0_g3_i1.p1 TRINITY_DN6291_c0_g3~~TRINITY_DN6291_c0_g3_i1.p1  ORF type:complete len:172 (+),score=6.06 TRINITY_DN6291_c0_g3_i1:1-516(+)